eukprot:GGOE01064991.1.p1 GENE.GGOE01064991.1~~GGOE01064991.1.p1  ORF type:complete len:175 (+),score=60.62 GGOE01064991.1:73-525(+)
MGTHRLPAVARRAGDAFSVSPVIAPRFATAVRMESQLRSAQSTPSMSAKVRHTVFLFFDAEKATAEKLQALKDAYAVLAKVDGIREGMVSFAVGPDLKLAPDQPDFVITAEFTSVEAYEAYAKHPAHLEMIATHIKPIMAKPTVRAQILL